MILQPFRWYPCMLPLFSAGFQHFLRFPYTFLAFWRSILNIIYLRNISKLVFTKIDDFSASFQGFLIKFQDFPEFPLIFLHSSCVFIKCQAPWIKVSFFAGDSKMLKHLCDLFFSTTLWCSALPAVNLWMLCSEVENNFKPLYTCKVFHSKENKYEALVFGMRNSV